jgi:hypothetical protein
MGSQFGKTKFYMKICRENLFLLAKVIQMSSVLRNGHFYWNFIVLLMFFEFWVTDSYLDMHVSLNLWNVNVMIDCTKKKKPSPKEFWHEIDEVNYHVLILKIWVLFWTKAAAVPYTWSLVEHPSSAVFIFMSPYQKIWQGQMVLACLSV